MALHTDCIIDDETEVIERLIWRWRGIKLERENYLFLETNDEILTPAQLGDWLQLSESTIHELCRTRAQERRNPMPFFKVGRAVRFNKTEVVKWLTNLEAESKN
jgi:excisionase family DNA binding protein